MIAALLFTLSLSQVGTTQRPAPPRDSTADAKTGTAVVRGKITNTDGRPLRRVQVRLNGESIPDGRNTSTNGLGQYELRDLPPGRYSLNASRAGYLAMSYGQSQPGELGRPFELADGQTMDKVDFTLPRTALISGRVVDETGEPLAGANVLVMQMRFFNGKRRLLPVRGNAVTDDTGQYRISSLEPGEYYVQASSRETWQADPPSKDMLGFMPTYFPASANPSEAQRVRVRAGQEAASTDIGLIPGKAAKISGTVFSLQGRPLAGESLRMSYEVHGESFMSMSGGQSTKVNPDGSFQFVNVAPAEYHLNIMTSATADRPIEAANVIVSTIAGDVEGLSIVTSSAGAWSGRVVVEDGAFPTPLTKLLVRALPVERDTAVSNAGGVMLDNGRVREDGSFELKNVVGSNRVGIGPLPEGWAIRRIEQSGRDYTNTPLDAQGQAVDGVTILLTSKFPDVTGAVHDDKGNASPAGTVLLFPEDTALWNEDLRTVRTARPDDSGNFRIRSIRPGDYLAVAVPRIQTNQWNDPDYLESLRQLAKRVAIHDDQSAALDLALTTPVVRQY
jgi:hypothetical protein